MECGVWRVEGEVWRVEREVSLATRAERLMSTLASAPTELIFVWLTLCQTAWSPRLVSMIQSIMFVP